MGRRREFGSVRKLPSGRWQARYPDLAGRLVAAPDTFPTKAGAATYLAQVEADRSRGGWVDPSAGSMTFRDYSRSWLAQRPGLRPRTVELYDSLLRKHLLPTFGSVGPVTVAKAYRLVKTLLATAPAPPC